MIGQINFLSSVLPLDAAVLGKPIHFIRQPLGTDFVNRLSDRWTGPLGSES